MERESSMSSSPAVGGGDSHSPSPVNQCDVVIEQHSPIIAAHQQEIVLKEGVERDLMTECKRACQDKKCSAGAHALTPIRISDTTLLCDRCGKIQKESVIVISCLVCDFGTCVMCGEKRHNDGHSASPRKRPAPSASIPSRVPLSTRQQEKMLQEMMMQEVQHEVEKTPTPTPQRPKKVKTELQKHIISQPEKQETTQSPPPAQTIQPPIRVPLSTRQQEKMLLEQDAGTSTIVVPDAPHPPATTNVPISERLQALLLARMDNESTTHPTRPSKKKPRRQHIPKVMSKPSPIHAKPIPTIKPPHQSLFPHVGEEIEVEWDSQFYPTRVVNVHSPPNLIEVEYQTHEYEIIDLNVIQWRVPSSKLILPPLSDMDLDRAKALRLLDDKPHVLLPVFAPTLVERDDNVAATTTATSPLPPLEEFPINCLVRVEARVGPGIKHNVGGVGRIIGYDPSTLLFRIRPVLGGGKIHATREQLMHEYIGSFGVGTTDKRPERCLIEPSSSPQPLPPVHDDDVVTLPSPSPPPPTTAHDSANDNWVRRSVRHAGTEQLERAGVKDLLARLQRDDPKLKILRLKNWLEADTNAIVLDLVFDLLAKSKTVQVLYCQNLEKAMDDQRMTHLIHLLQSNPRIWALNVGENFKITRAGWEKFADALPRTSITHLYAGSESTVSGNLKMRMRDAARENRKKHKLHDSRDNLDTIMAIGQMWWNPRNSSKVRAHIKDMVHTLDEGTFVALKLGAETRKMDEDDERVNGKIFWETARVVKGPCDVRGAPQRMFLLYFEGKEETRWIDLDESRLACTTTSQVVWGKSKKGGQWWPAMFFPEPEVLAFVFGLPVGNGPDDDASRIHILVGSDVVFKAWDQATTSELGINSMDAEFIRVRSSVEMELRRSRQRDE